METESIRKNVGLDGDLDFGQKNITTLQRNLLNKDEILRLETLKLLVILRGTKPILLDKMRYEEHPLAKKLKDSSITEYKPKWTKNIPEKIQAKEEKTEKKTTKNLRIDWDTF